MHIYIHEHSPLPLPLSHIYTHTHARTPFCIAFMKGMSYFQSSSKKPGHLCCIFRVLLLFYRKCTKFCTGNFCIGNKISWRALGLYTLLSDCGLLAAHAAAWRISDACVVSQDSSWGETYFAHYL